MAVKLLYFVLLPEVYLLHAKALRPIQAQNTSIRTLLGENLTTSFAKYRSMWGATTKKKNQKNTNQKTRSKSVFPPMQDTSTCGCCWGELAASPGGSNWSHSSNAVNQHWAQPAQLFALLIVQSLLHGVPPVPTTCDRAEMRGEGAVTSRKALLLVALGSWETLLPLLASPWDVGREVM